MIGTFHPPPVHLGLAGHQYTANPMDAAAQVLLPSHAEQLADDQVDPVGGRFNAERQQLLDQIAVARLRTITARAELGATHEFEVTCVRRAQRILLEDEQPPRRHAANNVDQATAWADVDLSGLRSELARLSGRAAILEQRVAPAPVSSPPAEDPATHVLQDVLRHAVEVTRDQRLRARAVAAEGRAQRPAQAGEAANGSSPIGYPHASGGDVSEVRPERASMVWSAAGVARAGPLSRPALTISRVLNKSTILDVGLPLLAVVIAILVILAWVR
jgi:hypothetical protein